MSRIPTPATITAAPAAAQPLLEAVKKQLGSAPNLFRITANSPAALEGYLSLNGALAKGALDAATRERIALAVAQVNGCRYCLAAHTISARTSPSSPTPRSPPTAMVIRVIPRPMQQ
jgi:AhpD family alkylhydroperoxidase